MKGGITVYLSDAEYEKAEAMRKASPHPSEWFNTSHYVDSLTKWAINQGKDRIYMADRVLQLLEEFVWREDVDRDGCRWCGKVIVGVNDRDVPVLDAESHAPTCQFRQACEIVAPTRRAKREKVEQELEDLAEAAK